MDPTNLQVSTTRWGSTVDMDITHMPTGICVSGSGVSSHLLYDQLVWELVQKVEEHEFEDYP